jgi:uncharacterized membrane protein YkoI
MAHSRDSALVVPMGALAHAAAALEQATGDRILEIRLANEAGSAAFEAALADGDSLRYMRITADDESTEIQVNDLPPWLHDYKLQAYMRSIGKEKVPIGSAILRAEHRQLAPATAAGIAKPLGGTNAVLAYFVQTYKDGKRALVMVDARSGTFIANPDELYEPPTPVELARRLVP